MRRLKNYVVATHKYVGTLMSSLLLMWCLTGFVLLFVGFPHASRQDRFVALEHLSDSSLEKVKLLPQTYSKGARLEMYNHRPVYRIKKGMKKELVIDAETLEVISSFDFQNCRQAAQAFVEGSLLRADTITQLDSWIPWHYYQPLLPFYKFYYDDEEHTVVYVSSTTGSVIQRTTRHSRWMARIGAIPHWVYFKQIKSKVSLHKTLVTVLGLLGLFACLSGLVLGFIRVKRNAEGKVTDWSVFKKPMYRYHHILGLFVGLFLCTYLLSGIFYTTGVPSWIAASKEGKSAMKTWNTEEAVVHLLPSDIFRQLPRQQELRQMTWGSSMGSPVIRAYYNDYKQAEVYTLEGDTSLQPFVCQQHDVLALAEDYFPDANVDLSVQRTYDYYYEENGMYHHPLPVFKVALNNDTKEVLYIDPKTGKAVEYLDHKKRVQRVLTKTLHKMELPLLYKYNTWRIIVSVIILTLCTVVSYTSLVLSLRYLKRKFNRGY